MLQFLSTVATVMVMVTVTMITAVVAMAAVEETMSKSTSVSQLTSMVREVLRLQLNELLSKRLTLQSILSQLVHKL